ncbi:uncharacterized protein RHO25_003531 [Cercospora beticola]|uniref:Major facilitator superfamily (MFS) profile domain-containing protein n=1 Tax=Cercospora beticola TaxID=122368 RepID=A0ABZ0NHA5_CERBT|nr:hypothetical protein RHO25_003531 [Cercospora beticola]CAK1360213.1 unnamed protein product [Cercospora beticola]
MSQTYDQHPQEGKDDKDEKTDAPSTRSDIEEGPRSIDEAEAGSPTKERKAGDGKFERDIHGIWWILAIFSILSCVFCFATDATLVADIQPDIIRDLGEFAKFPWLATAYALPGVVLVLVQSKLHSLFNIKWLYLWNFLIFELGSGIAGGAPTMNAMIVGRAIAGIGGCGVYIGSLTFFSVITTEKERPFYISLITPVWGVGTVLRPLIGGGFAESPVGWRWGFYMNLFLIIIVVPVIIWTLPSMTAEKTLTARQKWAKIDWLALTLFAGWCTAGFMIIVFGGSLYAWSSTSMIILYAIFGALTPALWLSHKYHPFVKVEDRMYPSHMLRNWKLGVLQYSIFSAPAAVYIAIFYVPLFFQFARDESPVEAATKLLPFVIMIAFISMMNGFLMSKLGYYMPWLLAGSILATIGGGLMYTVDYFTSTSYIYGYTIILGLGGGCFLLTAFGCVSAVVPDPDDVFNAIGVLSVAQCIGITLFPALAGCVFQNTGISLLRSIVPPDVPGDLNSILAGSYSDVYQSFDTALQDQVTGAIVEAMSNLYLMTVVACGPLVLLAPFLGFGRVAAE